MRVEFDFSELNLLAADLDSVPEKSGPFIRAAVEVSARNVKDDAGGRVSGRKHFKQAASAIDYELKGFQGFGSTVLQAEVGYNKDRPAGRLGNLVEFGAPGSANHLAPGGELQAALHGNEDDFVRGLERAVDDGLKASGL